jgi:ribosomal-protein-serine acetyltransferase
VDTRTFIRTSLRELIEEKSIALGVWVSGRYAGGTGYHRHDWQNMKTEIGYWLVEQLQGRGIMTAVVRGILPYGFLELGMHRIEIHCATENQKSRGIPERLGFKLDGIMRQAHKLYDSYVDLAVYAMLRDEFLSRRP